MTLTLLLMRHAKSAWDDPALDDRDRPLNKRGQRDAPDMGAWLAAERLIPSVVLVSSAVRTRATWELAAPHVKAKHPAEFRDDLYHASADHLLQTVRATGGTAGRKTGLKSGLKTGRAAGKLLIVGHNPGLEDVAKCLIGRGDKRARLALAAKFPTAAVAVIDFEASGWADVEPASGRLTHFMTPKCLRRATAPTVGADPANRRRQ